MSASAEFTLPLMIISPVGTLVMADFSSFYGLCRAAAGVFVVYAVALVVYRLYFSPIANFPGPFLARTTFWYEFYYNFIQKGEYYLEIESMHKKYGPIVRVTPDELHIRDPSYYSNLFVTSAVRKTDVYPRFGQGTGFEDMTAVSASHDRHRRARAPLEPFFSRAGITLVEPRVLTRVKKLCSRLDAERDTGKVVNLTYAFSSLITDVISSILFEEPSDYLSDPQFNEAWFETLSKGTISVGLFKHLPLFNYLMAAPAIRFLAERVTNWRVWDDKARRQILLTKLRPSDEAKTRSETTVLDHLIHSDLKESDLGPQGFPRLAQLIQQAGAHNVSFTMTTIVTYLLLDTDKERRLRDELQGVFMEHYMTGPSWRDLEKAPYLSACIKEGLRLAIGGMNRTPRVSPEADLYFGGWQIPKGTPVSMSSYWMHRDPAVFHEPHSFQPERWLGDPDTLKPMVKQYVPFAKGSRNCVGQNLVYMTMYLALANLFGPASAKAQLFETDEEDVRPIHGYLFPMAKLDSKGVRVKLSGSDKFVKIQSL